MAVHRTQDLMDRYFAAMGADEDFSAFFEEDVTWLMVDSGHEVRGAGPVRAYLLELHSRMLSGEQRPLVVTDGHAILEGRSVNPGGGNGSGLAFCLVYDVGDERIAAMRCYGTLARLMPAGDEDGRPDHT
ncbi:SnoaL-like domain-containing protein [Friedmanniella luteola]|uniref:SnoaL-like domain-containing protein n=1 Tax=Friedmanniella luteola TaxID=546871 RepID=A0A1H1ZRH7_9ACTN|nr:nuclear transport factor 2 family protein [Friedmanniella luteola]SDT35846.1 SnoaL-like domain-containing protein [Friedmanniella luteola]